MYDINISYYVMPHYPFKTHTKTYAAVHMSRSRFWFGIWARTLVICEKTFGRKEEMLKSRCFKQSAILWRDFCFFFGKFPGQSHEAQSSDDAETWEVTFEGLISIGVEALRCQVCRKLRSEALWKQVESQSFDLGSILATNSLVDLYNRYHPIHSF